MPGDTSFSANDDLIDLTGQPDVAIPLPPPTPPTAAPASPPMPYYNNYNYYSHGNQLGDIYGESFELQTKEITWLNKFLAPNHAFMQVMEARDATVQLYLAVLNELESRAKKMGSSLQRDAKAVEDTNFYNPYHSYSQYRDRSYISRSIVGNKVGAVIYYTLFQCCENAVRMRFDVPLMPDNQYVTGNPNAEYSFERYFGAALRELLPPLAAALPLPDEEAEQGLNQYYTERWKPRYEALTALLPSNVAGFVAGVYELGYLNDRNPALPLIYLEAARQLGEIDREQTLHLYFHYLHYGARRYGFKPKPLAKRLQKKLFPLPEHLARFEEISQHLLWNDDLDQATEAIPKIWYKERKKIELDPLAVQTARAQHSGTVELLNEYLQDEPEPAPTPAKPLKKAPTAPKTTAKPVPAAAPAATFAAGIALSAAQQALVQLFAAHKLALSQAQAETVAKQHGILRNQLIDGLNEACYALLDDVLVEETDTGYAIHPPYYQKITA